MDINPKNELAIPKRNLPRDVFLHLFAMVALYWSAISFITLCWQYVNYFFPDVLNYNYGFNSAMRFALASLFIVFPLFMLSSWLLNKIYSRESQVRDSKIRKWLIYLTLFIASLVIIGDLVFTVNTFLNGEITARFVLKALSVLIVAAAIFGYYLDDVRRQDPSKLTKIYALASIVIVLIMVAAAFFIVGSPVKARLAQIDQQRTSDLQNIQYQIVNYWQRKQQLPKNLSDLEDPISGYTVPQDPETKMPYEYTLVDDKNLKFELCATFSLQGDQQGMMSAPAVPMMYKDSQGNQGNWQHSAGHVCFERQIDKQLYPPLTK